MASLQGNTIASTFKDLLQVSNSNSGVDGTIRSVEDGEGTASALQISTDAVTVSGNFTVSGASTTVNTTDINAQDGLIRLATGNDTTDVIDIGFIGLYDTGGTDLHAGLFRDASDSGKWKLFEDSQQAGMSTATTVGTGETGYTEATLVASLEASTVDINGGTIDGVTIGGASAGAGTFTTFTSTGIDDNATSTAITIDSSENVIIGTNAVQGTTELLNVFNSTVEPGPNIAITSSLSDGSNYMGGLLYRINDGADTVVGYLRNKEHSSNSYGIDIGGYGAVGSPGTIMTLLGSGNVGIGAISVDELLHVQKDQNSGTTIKIENATAGTGANAKLQIKTDTSTQTLIQRFSPTFTTVGNNVADGLLIEDDGDGGIQLVNKSASGYLRIGTGASGSERMRIDSDGNVGIGTTSPAVELVVSNGGAGGIEFNAGDSSSTMTLYNRSTNAYTDLTIESKEFTVATGTSPSASMHIDSSGYVTLGSAHTAVGHFLVTQPSGTATQNARFRALNTSFNTGMMHLECSRSANTAYNFISADSSYGSADREFTVRGDGQVSGDQAYATPASDYAEFFESKDGTAIPIGTTVKLDGDKIVACSEGETPIGVIRPNGTTSVLGNSAWNKWCDKHLRDDYGTYLLESYSVVEWEGENGDTLQYHSDRVPEGITVPDDATTVSTYDDGTPLKRRILNPEYDDSLEYVDRELRDEWNVVGLLGQIPITKGQPVADSWVKMKDVSDTVEMWFVK